MTWRRAVLAFATLVGFAMISACAVADPDTSQSVLRYSGGWFNSRAFDSCIGPGIRDVTAVGKQHFYYPVGQRTYTFSDTELPGLVTAQAGADHFLVDNVQLGQPSLPDTLNAEINNLQAAGLRQATAATDKNTANQFGGTGPYLDYLSRRAGAEAQQAIADAIKSGQVRAIPVPFGSPVIIPPGG